MNSEHDLACGRFAVQRELIPARAVGTICHLTHECNIRFAARLNLQNEAAHGVRIRAASAGYSQW